MAKPQLEDGYIRLADEIARAFMKINLSPQETRILWVIIKETYGWRQKEKTIPLTRFSELTSMSKPHICDVLKKLQARRIIAKKDGKYSLQKDYEQWVGIKLPVAESFPKQGMLVPQAGNKNSPNRELPFPEQGKKFPKQGINVPQTGNGKSKLANKNKGNPSPTDITDTITDNTLNKRTISYPKYKSIIIEYLNKAVEKNFPIVSKVTDKFLKTRYSEGRTVEECKLVVDNRVKRWLKDPERYQYLRPSTLFRPTNFENWITEARAEQAKELTGRKKEIEYEELKKKTAERVHRELEEQARKRRQEAK